MTSFYSILATNYSAVGQATYTPTRYTAVKPNDYEGKWTGKFADGTTFTLQISNVQGFKAMVSYKSGGTVSSSEVLIGNSSFRIGDSKFVLGNNGHALVAQAVTDPVTGAVSVKRAYATRS